MIMRPGATRRGKGELRHTPVGLSSFSPHLLGAEAGRGLDGGIGAGGQEPEMVWGALGLPCHYRPRLCTWHN